MPSLPLDLERLIFEMVALQCTNHDSKVQLTLVAKRIYEWYLYMRYRDDLANSHRKCRIRPILYRVAIAEELSKEGLTIRNWRNAPVTDIAPFARHLLISSPLTDSISRTLELLSTFHNVENLAIWRNGSVGIQVLEKLQDLPLRRLSVGLKDTGLDEAVNHCSAFMNITHLEIIALPEGSETYNDCKALVELPKLTHLCFEPLVEVEDHVLLDLLVHCPSLRVMIYQPMYECIETDDPRFLVLDDNPDVEEAIEEWEMSANGGIGLWELADMIIEARKGEV